MYLIKSLSDKLSGFKQIPTLPHILLQLIQICNADSTSLKEIAGIIEKDPALSVRILKLVNSSYYSLNNRICSVDDAVMFLGTNAIKNVAICSSVHEVFQNVKPRKGFNLKHFWWHALRCAVLSKLIATNQKFHTPDEAFLFGMLHDIGKIILWINFPEQYEKLLETRKDHPDLIIAGETQLGATHAEIGAWILNEWNFQHEIVDAVLCHHYPAYSMLNAPALSQFIYAANLLSSDSVQKNKEGISASEKIFGFSKLMIEEFLRQADDEVMTMAESLNIEIGPFKANDFAYSEDDRKKETILTQDVRDRSLLLNTVQNLLEATDETAIWVETSQGLQILFELTMILFFRFDTENDCLRGVILPDSVKSAGIKDMTVPMEMEESLLIDCLKDRTINDSFNWSTRPASGNLDRQLIQLLGKDGIVCIPMVAHGQKIGVIVLGLGLLEFSGLKSQMQLLQMLADQAAIAIRVHHLERSQLQQIKPEGRISSSSTMQQNEQKSRNPWRIFKKYLKSQ